MKILAEAVYWLLKPGFNLYVVIVCIWEDICPNYFLFTKKFPRTVGTFEISTKG